MRTAYAIIGKDGNIRTDTIRSYRKDCISFFIEGSVFSWKDVKKYGWRCIKVKISEIKEEK